MQRGKRSLQSWSEHQVEPGTCVGACPAPGWSTAETACMSLTCDASLQVAAFAKGQQFEFAAPPVCMCCCSVISPHCVQLLHSSRRGGVRSCPLPASRLQGPRSPL